MDTLQPIVSLLYFFCLLGLSCYGLHRYLMIGLYYRYRRNKPVPAGRWHKLPAVTVQLPIYNERYVIERLVDAVCRFDYPRDRLEIQVLDDSTDETQEIARAKCDAMRAQGYDIHYIHRDDRSGYKAGALQHGMKSAKGELILIFDADFLPAPELLKKTVHYFTDPKIGMVQSRWGHLNANFSLLTRVQAALVDAHLLIEQTARSRSGRFFNFNGTAGIWRRSCIDHAGGWHADTLAEDTDLSYRAQLKGWRFIFLSDVVTPAELPVDINAFKAQQHRWAKGLIQTCLKVLPTILRSPLPFKVKAEAFVHLTANFGYLLMLGMCLLLGPNIQLPSNPAWAWTQMLALGGPVFTIAGLSIVVFYLCAQYELRRNLRSSVLMIPLLMAIGLGLTLNNAKAVIEAMIGHQTEFNRTPKYGIRQVGEQWTHKKYSVLRGVLPYLELAFGLYFSWLVLWCIRHEQWGNLPFLLVFPVGFLWMAGLSFFQQPPHQASAPDSVQELDAAEV